jgi:hypothetical protein
MSTSPTPPSTNQPPTWPVLPPTHRWDAPAPGYDPTRHWGTSPTPPKPKRKRGGRILLATAIGVALLVATGVVAGGATAGTGVDPTPPTTPSPGPADPPGESSDLPEENPKAEAEPVEVPTVVGMTQAEAKQALADRGLKATTKYQSTAEYPAGIVISQSHDAGAGVPPGTAVSLVVAKTPPPPPPTAPPAPTTTPAQKCDPSYPDVCLDPAVQDYDCAGGSGNGPEYAEGPIRVRPPDPFDLDRDGDGWGCDAG